MSKRLSTEDKAGVYMTVIIHLAVIIVLLVSGLGFSLKSENSFVLDFSKYEDIEKLQREAEKLEKELAFKQSIADKLEKELAAAGARSEVRNVAVDRSQLKDDRGTDAEQLYKDAERLQKELSSGYELPSADIADPKASSSDKKKEESKPAAYQGPSVVSYELSGRKASHLPIPAYRCQGGGEVKVLIGVSPVGAVVEAKVDDSASSSDQCLRSYAIRAARLSKFSIKSDAPSKQSGYIIYSFIAQ